MRLSYESGVRGALRDGEVELWHHEEQVKRIDAGPRELLIFFGVTGIICAFMWVCGWGRPGVAVGLGLSLVVLIAIGLLALLDRFRSRPPRVYRLTNERLLFLQNKQCTEVYYRRIPGIEVTRSLRNGTCSVTLDHITISKLADTRTLHRLVCDEFVAAGRRPRRRISGARPPMNHTETPVPAPDWLELLHGEHLLWQGRPDPSLRGRFTWRRLTIAPALVCLCAWILVVQFRWIKGSFFEMRFPTAFSWIAGIVLLITLATINGWIQEFRMHRRMHYALTNLRAITMIKTRRAVTIRSLFLDMIAEMTASVASANSDEVTIAANDADEMEGNGDVNLARISFSRIQNPAKVAALVLQAISDLGNR